MKYADLMSRFTELANDLLSKGMTFTLSMRGHQGELAKVDLTDGSNVYRALIYEYNTGLFKEVTTIEIRKYEGKTGLESYNTLWNDAGELIHKEEYVDVDRKRGEGTEWFVSMEEGYRCNKIRQERYEARYDASRGFVRFQDAERREVALRYIRKQPRCKSKKLSYIAYVCKNVYGKYEIVTEDCKTYRLH